MKTSLDCMECNIKQLIKISKFVGATEEQKEKATRKLLEKLSKVSYDKSNPFIMSETWKIITDIYQNDNPYRDVKRNYNQLLLGIYKEVKEIINSSGSPLHTALKIAVVGNLIDFGARHKFTEEDLLNSIKNYNDINFAIDNTQDLEEKIITSKTLLYIGDNCGEIVLDKQFIEQIKIKNPKLKIYFSVRGGTILNDVTIEDATDVKMSDVAHVISSGVAIPGTILAESSDEFNDIFTSADIIIAKGQGNYESLSDIKQEGLFLLLMAKCNYVARTIGCELMDYIALENK